MKRLCLTLLMTAAITTAATNANAQQDNNDSGPRGGATITETPKNYVVEGIGVVVLFGAAVFGVCRSSRRGT